MPIRGKEMIKYYSLIVLSMISISTWAGDYYSQHATGWHWYDDPKEENNDKKITENEKTASISNDPNVVVSEAKKRVKTALNQMIAQPTPDNVKNYITLQEQLNDRAEKIANLWEEVLLKNPQLNYSLTHPTNNIGLQVYHEQESIQKDQAMRIFAEKTGLFFFYKSTCPYCKRFSPILKSFADKNGMVIIPITLDGIALPEFPNSKVDTGQAAQFKVSVTPAVFAVNPYTQKAFPVAYGLTSETELRDNIYKIMKNSQGS